VRQYRNFKNRHTWEKEIGNHGC